MSVYTISGIRFENVGKTDAQARIKALLNKRGACVFTPNAIILHKTSKSKKLKELLSSADLLLPDGIGVSLACRIRGLPRQVRITGIDTAHWLMRYASRNELSVYLLGGAHGIAKQAARRLRRDIPTLKICGAHHGYFNKRADSEENRSVIDHINRAAPDILFVCMGFPIQEAWIKANISKLPSVRVAMGLGGSLDVWSGKISRAPLIFQRMGLEWLWRSIISPKRFFELASLPTFFLELKMSK